MATIGLAITTNKLEAVALRYVPYSTKRGISECSIVNHCSDSTQLSDSQLLQIEAKYSTQDTKVIVGNATKTFHEARNQTFEQLSTDIQVKWDDDHVFAQDFGHEIFRDRLLSAISKYGKGIFYFQIPTFAIHPRLLTKDRVLCGVSGDVFAFTKETANVEFCEDSLYSDRQIHKSQSKVNLGNVGVLHLDQLKPFKYLAYRSHLNGKLRNFNMKSDSLEDAWQATFSQPIEHTITRLVQKMNANPEKYFVQAPEHWVSQLPSTYYDLRDLSVSEFRKKVFNESDGLDFSLDCVPKLNMMDLNIPSTAIYKDF